MKLETRVRLFFWYFSHFKVAMIGYLKPRLISINDEEVVICLRLNRRSRNHLNSMYFGALSVGADLAGGIHAIYHSIKSNSKITMVFKSFQAQFLKRPESDVYFVCTMGKTVEAMIEESKETGERINKQMDIKAYINYPSQPEEVATFTLELSIKALGSKG